MHQELRSLGRGGEGLEGDHLALGCFRILVLVIALRLINKDARIPGFSWLIVASTISRISVATIIVKRLNSAIV
jgi:hypothetical protein